MKTVRWFAYLALLIGFAQVVFGAIVRITGSGLGCGDSWPDCYGSFTPAHNAPTLLVGKLGSGTVNVNASLTASPTPRNRWASSTPS